MSKPKPMLEAPKKSERRLTTEQEEWAKRVRERNEWLARGRTGKAPGAIYGGRLLDRELGADNRRDATVGSDVAGPSGDAGEAPSGARVEIPGAPQEPGATSSPASGRAAGKRAVAREAMSRAEQFRQASERKKP